MSDEALLSYAQNGEDVVLWRALGHVAEGVYVDVGAWDPDDDSVTRLFYDRGWRGIAVEPVPEFAEKFRRRRPRDEVVQAVITDDDVDEVVLHRFGTSGLSTADDELADRHVEEGRVSVEITVPALRLNDVLAASPLATDEIHFLKVDVEGFEGRVLRSVDLARWRPWVLVVEATEPNSTRTTHERWESLLLENGYTFTLFDGLSRYYVAAEHPELAEQLSYPACPLDGFETAHQAALRVRAAQYDQDIREARERANRWRTEAMGYWANALATTQVSEEAALRARKRAERAGAQLARTQANLREVRADREKLRAKVKRMRARIERLERERGDVASRSTRGQLRAAVKKVTGA